MSRNKREQQRDWGDNQTSSALTPEQLAAMGYGLAADVANGIESIPRTEKSVIPEGSIVPQKNGTWRLGNVVLTRVGIEMPKDFDLDQYRALGEKLLNVSDALVWWIGDWLNYGVGREWGTSVRELMEKLELKADTLYHYAWLANKVKIWIRNPDLTPAHHRLVAKFDEETQRELLEWAATGNNGKPVKISQMRDKIRMLEKQDPPALSSESIVNPKFDKKYHGIFRDYNEANSDDQLKIIEALRHLLYEMERRHK